MAKILESETAYLYDLMFRLPDLHIGILLARRARYISTSLWFLFAVIGLALMAAQFSGRQPATVTVDVGLSAIRLLLPIMVIMLVQELVSREFEQRYFLTSLTYPRPRYWLLLGRLFAILLLTYTLLIVIAIALAFTAIQVAHGYAQATPVDFGITYWVTVSFIAIDLLVLTAMAVLLSVVASTPSFVLIGTLGFMLIARSYSNIIALLERNQYVVDNPGIYQQSLSILHYILPDLGALDVRMITLYGHMEMLPDDWFSNASACLTYSVFLLLLAIYFLNRKHFN